MFAMEELCNCIVIRVCAPRRDDLIIVELITGLVLVLVIVELPKCKSAFRPISVRLQLTSRLVGLNIVVNVCLNIV